MIWIARKAFFGRVPFPALHVDTGKKFPEMYAFRDRYAVEWNLDLNVEHCPPIDVVDPTLAAGCTFRGAQDRRTEARACQIQVRRPDRRHPARRGADARQGTRVLAARARRRMGRARPAAGVLGSVQRLAAARRAPAHPSDPALDRAGHLDLHASAKASRSSRCILRATASAIARSATTTSRLRCPRRRDDRRRSSPNSKPRKCLSAPDARWTTNPKTPSSGFASPAICNPQRRREARHEYPRHQSLPPSASSSPVIARWFGS